MDKYELQRKSLVEELKQQGIKDKKVLNAILKIPRHLFVKKESINESYSNYPLPILSSQTISQPYTVAFMLEALELKETDKVFEIGTGSGWNACLIAEICKKGKVITTEIIPSLVKFAAKNIKKTNLKNIKVLNIDGSKGYKKEIFDKIIITAACSEIPEELLNQLKNNGILIAPIGPEFSQIMLKIKKRNGNIIKENLGDFVFVPLTH